MKEESKEYHYTVGLYDIICRYIREKISEGAKQEGAYGIGVFSDRYCEEVLMSRPLKNLKQRMEIAKSFEGVDFVFEVDEKDKVEEEAEKAYQRFKQKQEDERKQKQYKVGFIIGSFDVFHSGHLENINIAKQLCDKLYVVLKTDERILNNKEKVTQQSTAERAAILKCIKQIENIIYMDLDTTRSDIIEDIVKISGGTNKKDIVAVFGSDLQEKEEPFIAKDWKDINVVFTNRDPENMKIVSSTYYEGKCQDNGKIEILENREEEAHL